MNRLVFLILMTATIMAQGCSTEPEVTPEVIRPVKTVTAGEHLSAKLWTFAGTAEDARETDLSFRVAGKIITFPGDQIGHRFAKGDVIARLDPADYELQLRQAKAQQEQVRAGFVRAEADVLRIRKLFADKVMSRSELDQAEAEFNSYGAQLNASSKALDLTRKHLAYTMVHAPFDGWITGVRTDVYQNVSSGQPIVSFSAGTQMKMYVSIPDTLISQIHEGEEVAVSFDALPGKNLRGRVMEIGLSSTPGSAYPVKVYLDNTDGSIRSGMSGHVDFLGRTHGNSRIFLPLAAVMGSPEGERSVWVVDPATSTVTSRRVSLGVVTAYGIEIISGVGPGEIIVTRGVHHLKEGLKVRLQKTPVEG